MFFVDELRLLGFSHSAVGVCRGTLGLFEMFSSSCSPSFPSSVLPLIMLSPSPYSESVKSMDISATSPYGVFTLSNVSPTSGRISGSTDEDWFGSG